jgi:hypothetical protein
MRENAGRVPEALYRHFLLFEPDWRAGNNQQQVEKSKRGKEKSNRRDATHSRCKKIRNHPFLP